MWFAGGCLGESTLRYTVSPVKWDTYFQANRVENQKLIILIPGTLSSVGYFVVEVFIS